MTPYQNWLTEMFSRGVNPPNKRNWEHSPLRRFYVLGLPWPLTVKSFMYIHAAFQLWYPERGVIKMITPWMTSYICDCNINGRLWLEENRQTLNDSGSSIWTNPNFSPFHQSNECPFSTIWLNMLSVPRCIFFSNYWADQFHHPRLRNQSYETHRKMTPVATEI